MEITRQTMELRFKPNAFPVNSVTALVGAFPLEWYLLYSQWYFFVIFVYYVLINCLSSSQRSRLMSHGVSKTLYVRNVPYYLICTGFCNEYFNSVQPTWPNRNILCIRPLKWEKRAIDTGKWNKKSGPNSHPLLSRHHLCVGFSLTVQAFFASERWGWQRVQCFWCLHLRWPPLKAPILWGEGSRFGS